MTVLNLFKVLLAFATAALIVGTGTVAGLFWHFSHGLPDHKQLADYQPPTVTRLYAADGRLLAEYAPREARLRADRGHAQARRRRPSSRPRTSASSRHPGIDSDRRRCAP